MIHLPFIRPHQSPTFALAWFVSPAHGTVARRLMLPTSRPWNWHISTTTPGIDIGWTWSHWGTGVARGLFLLWGYGRHSRGVLSTLISDVRLSFQNIPFNSWMIWYDLEWFISGEPGFELGGRVAQAPGKIDAHTCKALGPIGYRKCKGQQKKNLTFLPRRQQGRRLKKKVSFWLALPCMHWMCGELFWLFWKVFECFGSFLNVLGMLWKFF